MCNMCAFPNFSSSFLLDTDIPNTDNSFGLLQSSDNSDIGPPLSSSSPTGQQGVSDKSFGVRRKHRKKLKCLSLNCNGLKGPGKQANFHALIDLHKPDVILGCESKLDSTIPTYSVFPPTYNVFRRDRTAHGGGVFIACRNDLVAIEENKLQVPGCEVIWISLQFARTKKLFLGSFYRPPNSGENPLESLDDSISSLFNKPGHFPQVILSGDFNCGHIDWNAGELMASASVADNILLNTAFKYGLSQHVNSPTRQASGKVLDLVLSSYPNIIPSTHVVPGISDHDAVLFEVDQSPKYVPKPPRKIYQFHKGNFETLNEDLKSLSTQYFSSSPDSRSVNENWEMFSSILKEKVDENIPHKMSKSKRHLPWVSDSVKRQMRSRDRAFKKAKKTGKVQHWAAYRQKRNATVALIRENHTKYVNEVVGGLVDSSADNSKVKRAWSYLKLLKTEQCGIPTLTSTNNRICSSDSSKANALQSQFTSVFTKENLHSIPVLPSDPLPSMADIRISTAGVKAQLEKLNPNKASGPDEIHARVLRESSQEIAPIMAHLFQQSLDTGQVPEEWKRANVSALFKKGPKHNPSNYRPVSLTCICSKVLEHIVCSNVSNHLSHHYVLNDNQHGFRRGLSCETQLTTTVHEWAKTLNHHGQTDVIFLDFSKAFDSVPHERLLSKLAHYGITGRLHNWFRAFLTDRSQRVVVNGSSSPWSKVQSGVPQGAVLGPLLFLIYVNDLPTNLKSTTKLFADDSVLYRQINSLEDHLLLQNDLETLSRWAKDWQMRFEPSKCYTLVISLKKQPSTFTYTLSGSSLAQVTYHKYLGVHITNNLSWSRHCNELRLKANRVLGVLQRNLSRCSREIKERAYLCLVRPQLEYSTTTWSPYTRKDMKTIESVQRRAARFTVSNYKRTSSVTDMLTELGWESLEKRRTLNDLVFFFKIQNNLINIDFPNDMTKYFRSERLHHKFNFRQLSSSVDVFKYSFFVRSIPLWNALPSEIVNAQSVSCFRSLISM